MPNPYWDAVGHQIEAGENLKWAHKRRIAIRDREAHERARKNMAKARAAKKRLARKKTA